MPSGAGRKKTPVASLFNDVEDKDVGKVAKVKCKYCSIVLSKNGTRMAQHIASCKKCDEVIKKKYLSRGFTGKPSNRVHETEMVSDDEISLLDISVRESTPNKSKNSTPTVERVFTECGRITPVSCSLESSLTKEIVSNEASSSSSTQSKTFLYSDTFKDHSYSGAVKSKTTIKPFIDHMSKAQLVSNLLLRYCTFILEFLLDKIRQSVYLEPIKKLQYCFFIPE